MVISKKSFLPPGTEWTRDKQNCVVTAVTAGPGAAHGRSCACAHLLLAEPELAGKAPWGDATRADCWRTVRIQPGKESRRDSHTEGGRHTGKRFGLSRAQVLGWEEALKAMLRSLRFSMRSEKVSRQGGRNSISCALERSLPEMEGKGLEEVRLGRGDPGRQ